MPDEPQVEVHVYAQVAGVEVDEAGTETADPITITVERVFRFDLRNIEMIGFEQNPISLDAFVPCPGHIES